MVIGVRWIANLIKLQEILSGIVLVNVLRQLLGVNTALKQMGDKIMCIALSSQSADVFLMGHVLLQSPPVARSPLVSIIANKPAPDKALPVRISKIHCLDILTLIPYKDAFVDVLGEFLKFCTNLTNLGHVSNLMGGIADNTN